MAQVTQSVSFPPVHVPHVLWQGIQSPSRRKCFAGQSVHTHVLLTLTQWSCAHVVEHAGSSHIPLWNWRPFAHLSQVAGPLHC